MEISKSLCFFVPWLLKIQRVRSNAIRQNQSLRAASATSGFCNDGVRMRRCSHLAHASRRAKAASQSRAILWRASLHAVASRLHAASGAMASSADSKAMDMPLPVTGGIIVMASPVQIPCAMLRVAVAAKARQWRKRNSRRTPLRPAARAAVNRAGRVTSCANSLPHHSRLRVCGIGRKCLPHHR